MDSFAEAGRLFRDGLASHEQGDLERAEGLYRRALELAPERASVMNNLAAVFIELEKYSEARPLCERLLAIDPADETALLNLGICQWKQGDPAAALLTYQQALARRPDFANALNNCGSALLELARPQEALASIERALAVMPDHAEALNNRGNALLELNRPDEALASYERALSIRPGYAEALFNLGTALLDLARPEPALASLDRAIALKPGYAEALNNRGNALLRLRRLEEALASFDRALEARPGYAEAINNRGDALIGLERHEELVANYRELLRVRPDYDYAPGYLLRAQLRCCSWEDYEGLAGRISSSVRAGGRSDAPFDFLVISDSADDQLRCARTFAADKYPEAAPIWKGERYRHDRIRVAYLSGDLRNHAVAYLIAGLIEAHDRTRFEITALSFGPGGGDEMGARLVPAFDRFVDVGGRTDREAALLLRELEIDIAVDLQGYTRGCRPGIFAQRAAPVQVNYLGYPGTMGAPYMDYIIGDPTVMPPGHESGYAEQGVTLPGSYQVNDAKRRIAARVPARAEQGLPEKGFVFCCFNNNHKINPAVFDIWMRLLRGVKDSVLWLLRDNEIAARNLRREAERRGVAPDRLVFAPRVKMEEHLARHRLADLFLDTLPYNAHVTASDALWAGLPVLTRIGHTFAGRVAASLLAAAGLPELVTRSWKEYEELALKLAANGNLLAGLRAKLAQNRATCPLFDTDRSRRHIEAAYTTMWERARRGEPAAGFRVPGK